MRSACGGAAKAAPLPLRAGPALSEKWRAVGLKLFCDEARTMSVTRIWPEYPDDTRTFRMFAEVAAANLVQIAEPSTSR